MDNKLYPNRDALASIYEQNRLLAMGLSTINTGTPVGRQIAESMPWLFTETELRVAVLDQIYRKARDYRDGDCMSEGIELECKELGIPTISFCDWDGCLGPDDFPVPKNLPDPCTVGSIIDFEGSRLMVLYDNGNEFLLTAPASMIIYTPKDGGLKFTDSPVESLKARELRIAAATLRAKTIHRVLSTGKP